MKAPLFGWGSDRFSSIVELVAHFLLDLRVRNSNLGTGKYVRLVHVIFRIVVLDARVNHFWKHGSNLSFVSSSTSLLLAAC